MGTGSSSVLAASLIFVLAAGVSLAASGLLVTRLERLSARLGLAEAMLGLVIALAADSPEISTAITALARGQHDVGAGVVLGSNVFNLAALLGLGSLVAGRIALHRRVVLLEGAVAVWIAAVAIGATTRFISVAVALALAAVALAPYVVVSAVHPRRRDRLPVPERWGRWLSGAVNEEELELADTLTASKGGRADTMAGAAALAVVIGASVVMEHTGTSIADRYALPGIVTGGVVLAAVTSLPNAVSAVYLATRGRGSATLSGALNSNTLNVVAGLLLPAAIVGLENATSTVALTAAWYGGLTVTTLVLAFRGHGLRRAGGAIIVAAYLAYVVVIVTR